MMMTLDQIIQLVSNTLSDYTLEQELAITVDSQTPLFGPNSALDSMGLVHVIVDIESRLRDAGHPVSLISEQAMSQRNSPFRTVTTLAEFIQSQSTA